MSRTTEEVATILGIPAQEVNILEGKLSSVKQFEKALSVVSYGASEAISLSAEQWDTISLEIAKNATSAKELGQVYFLARKSCQAWRLAEQKALKMAKDASSAKESSKAYYASPPGSETAQLAHKKWNDMALELATNTNSIEEVEEALQFGDSDSDTLKLLEEKWCTLILETCKDATTEETEKTIGTALANYLFRQAYGCHDVAYKAAEKAFDASPDGYKMHYLAIDKWFELALKRITKDYVHRHNEAPEGSEWRRELNEIALNGAKHPLIYEIIDTYSNAPEGSEQQRLAWEKWCILSLELTNAASSTKEVSEAFNAAPPGSIAQRAAWEKLNSLSLEMAKNASSREDLWEAIEAAPYDSEAYWLAEHKLDALYDNNQIQESRHEAESKSLLLSVNAKSINEAKEAFGKAFYDGPSPWLAWEKWLGFVTTTDQAKELFDELHSRYKMQPFTMKKWLSLVTAPNQAKEAYDAARTNSLSKLMVIHWLLGH